MFTIEHPYNMSHYVHNMTHVQYTAVSEGWLMWAFTGAAMQRIDRQVLKLIHRDISLTQQQMATLLNVNRRTIIRSVNRLRSMELIRIQSGGGRVPYDYQIAYDKLAQHIRDELIPQ